MEPTDTTPSIFVPYDLLNGGVRYRDLSNHDFTAQEKNWVCEEISGFHNSDKGKRMTMQVFIDRFKISMEDMEIWYGRFREGQEQLSTSWLCPVNDNGIDHITELINSKFPAEIESDNFRNNFEDALKNYHR
jgi:hypothetical protein